MGGQELDGLLGNESPSKEADSSCWGRKKKKKKKKSLPEDTVSVCGGLNKWSKEVMVFVWHLFSFSTFAACVFSGTEWGPSLASPKAPKEQRCCGILQWLNHI